MECSGGGGGGNDKNMGEFWVEREASEKMPRFNVFSRNKNIISLKIFPNHGRI